MRQRRVLRAVLVIFALATESFAASEGPMVFRTPEGDKALCAQGVAARCYDVGQALARGGASAMPQVLMTYDRSCRLGWSAACREYVALKLANEVRAADEVLLDYSRECKGGVGAACHYQALIYLYQNKRLKRFAKAAGAQGQRAGELLVQACLGGQGVACSEMGMVLTSVGKTAEAEAYLRKGCFGGDGSACSHNGARPSLMGDTGAMKALFGKGCTLGDVTSCYYLGGALELSPRAADQREAQQYYLLSCGLGVTKACVRVSGMRIKDGDLEGARAVLDGACGQGDPESCQLLGRVTRLTYGDGEPYFKKAAALYQDACGQGDGRACGMGNQARRLAQQSRFSGFLAALRYTLAVRMGRVIKF